MSLLYCSYSCICASWVCWVVLARLCCRVLPLSRSVLCPHGEEFNDLIPKWMGFVKGIVDSDDMPLNIGREKLQQNAILKHIKTGLQKSIFQMFTELSKDPERNKAFHDSFSQCLKLGIYEDNANRQNIIPLLRYHSSKSGDGLVSFDEYIGRTTGAGASRDWGNAGRAGSESQNSPKRDPAPRHSSRLLPLPSHKLESVRRPESWSHSSTA